MVLVMPLPRPVLRPVSIDPLYQQVVDHVVAAIAAGELLPGERIPALRDLADDWQIGHSTIVRAMSILQGRGVLEAKAGKGTFVKRQPGE